MKKKITIDTLARMTQDEFSRTAGRFDKIDNRLGKMDATLKTILDVVLEIPSKKAFERLENKVQVLDAELASIERRISK